MLTTPDTGIDAEPGVLDRIRAWERRTGHPIRIVTTGLAGLLTAIVLCAPFGLPIFQLGTASVPAKPNLIYEMFNTAGEYPYASVNAYNPWALASVDGSGVAANGSWACDSVILNPPAGSTFCPEAVMIGPLPAVIVGAALLIAAFVIVSLLVARRPTPLVILTGVTILAIAFFILPTRVHERYLFPLVAVGAILAAISVRWRVAYLVLSLTTFLNMYVVLTTLYGDNPGIRDWLGIGDGIRSTTSVQLIALTALAASLWAFVQLRPGAQRALERELGAGADAAADEGDVEEWAADRGPRRPGRARPAARTAIDSRPGPAEPRGRRSRRGRRRAGPGSRLRGRTRRRRRRGLPRAAAFPTWTELPSFGELGPIGWFRSRLAQRPVRADRSQRPPRRAARPPRQAGPVDPRRPGRRRSSGSGCSGCPSRTRCTSTRSITPGRRPSSSRAGATGSTTTSTSGPIRTSRNTRWPAAWSRGATIG